VNTTCGEITVPVHSGCGAAPGISSASITTAGSPSSTVPLMISGATAVVVMAAASTHATLVMRAILPPIRSGCAVAPLLEPGLGDAVLVGDDHEVRERFLAVVRRPRAGV